MEKEPLQKNIELISWLILAVFLALSGIFFSRRFTLGILCGGLISILNFRLLYRSLSGFFQQIAGKGAKPAVLFNYYLRIAVTGVVLFFLISRAITDVIGLLTGLSIVVISIMLAVGIMLSKKSYIEEVQ